MIGDKLSKITRKESDMPLTTISKHPPLFPYRLNKNVDESKFRKFMAMLMKLSMNVPLVDAL